MSCGAAKDSFAPTALTAKFTPTTAFGAVAQPWNDGEERKLPSLAKEGWLRDQENVAKQPELAQTGGEAASPIGRSHQEVVGSSHRLIGS